MSDKTFIPEAKVPYNFLREVNSNLDKLDYISAYITQSLSRTRVMRFPHLMGNL